MSGWVAGAIVVAGVGGAAISANASGNVAAAQEQASNNAQQTQWNMYSQTAGNLAPYNKTGQQATKALAGYYGLPGGSTPPGGWNAYLQNLPGYQFQAQQGNLAVQRNLAASGLLDSGAAGKELQQYGQGLASQYGQTYAAGLAGLAGQGESAAAMQGYAGSNAANNISGSQIYSGNAAAAGNVGQANAYNSGLAGLAGFASSYANYNNNAQPSTYGLGYDYGAATGYGA